MNGQQKKTFNAIFRDPVNGNIEWNKIESLLRSVGCNVIEGSGSSVMFEKDGMRESFHRPHPEKEALRYRVKAVRRFMIRLGVES